MVLSFYFCSPICLLSSLQLLYVASRMIVLLGTIITCVLSCLLSNYPPLVLEAVTIPGLVHSCIQAEEHCGAEATGALRKQ